MAAEHHIYLLCGGDLGVISPLRVAHLMMERLGGAGQDARHAAASVQVGHGGWEGRARKKERPPSDPPGSGAPGFGVSHPQDNHLTPPHPTPTPPHPPTPTPHPPPPRSCTTSRTAPP
jgi:hypothetical protein